MKHPPSLCTVKQEFLLYNMVDDKRLIESREGFDMECSLLAHVRADRGSDVGAADVTQRRVIGAELMKLCRQEVELRTRS